MLHTFLELFAVLVTLFLSFPFFCRDFLACNTSHEVSTKYQDSLTRDATEIITVNTYISVSLCSDTIISIKLQQESFCRTPERFRVQGLRPCQCCQRGKNNGCKLLGDLAWTAHKGKSLGRLFVCVIVALREVEWETTKEQTRSLARERGSRSGIPG